MENKTKMGNTCIVCIFNSGTDTCIIAEKNSLFVQTSNWTLIRKSIGIFNPLAFFNHSNSPINKEPSTHNHVKSFWTHSTQSFSHSRSSLISLRRRRHRRDPTLPPFRGLRSLAAGEPQGYPHRRRWEDRKKIPDRCFPRRHR